MAQLLSKNILEAAKLIVEAQHCSIPFLQRKLKLLPKCVEKVAKQLEELGIVALNPETKELEVKELSVNEIEKLFHKKLCWDCKKE